MATDSQGVPLDPLAALAAVLAGCAVLIVFLGLRTYYLQTQLEAWLRIFVAGSPGAVLNRRAGRPSLRDLLTPTLAWVARRVHDVLPVQSVARMRANLVSAGYPSRRDLSNFLAAKALLAVLLGLPGPLLIVPTGVPLTLIVLITLIGVLIGFYLPGIWLGRRIKQRRVQISRSLPDALDLLAISVGAGLGFDGALAEVLQGWQNALTEELNTAQRDMRLGTSRREALRALNDRAGVPEVSSLVAAVVQSDELGTPLRDALRLQAEHMRQQRRLKAEVRARQAVIKMMIPMVLFIFPAIFVVLLGPTLPILMTFTSGGGAGK